MVIVAFMFIVPFSIGIFIVIVRHLVCIERITKNTTEILKNQEKEIGETLGLLKSIDKSLKIKNIQERK